ncbi:MAG: EAL domain-containing protein [Janthinobacterium lividum]
MDVSHSRALPPDAATLSADALPVSLATLRARVAAHPALGARILFDADGQARARHRDARLGSGFSCVSDVADPAAPRVFARRAVLQVRDAAGLPLPAEEFFNTLDSDGDLIDADRLSRSVHVLNFLAQATQGLLFLPVQPRLLKSIRYDHGRYFADLLLSLGVNPASVVIEIPAVAAAHRTFLAYLVDSYRRHGFKVAAHLASAATILAVQTGRTPHFVMVDARQALRDAMVAPLLAYAAHHGVCPIFKCVDGSAALGLLRQHGVRFIDAGDAV